MVFCAIVGKCTTLLSFANSLARQQSQNKVHGRCATIEVCCELFLKANSYHNAMVAKTQELFPDHTVMVLCDHISQNCTFEHIRPTQTDFDIFNDTSEFPTLCVLLGSDGGIQHSVATVQDYLFDSNLKQATKVSREILDWCVSADGIPVSFEKVYWAIRLIRLPPPNKHYGTIFGCSLHLGLANLLFVMNQNASGEGIIHLHEELGCSNKETSSSAASVARIKDTNPFLKH